MARYYEPLSDNELTADCALPSVMCQNYDTLLAYNGRAIHAPLTPHDGTPCSPSNHSHARSMVLTVFGLNLRPSLAIMASGVKDI